MESERTNDDGALGYWAKHRREIPMYRWFKAVNGEGAPFVVVDRITRGTGKDFETVALKILVYPTN